MYDSLEDKTIKCKFCDFEGEFKYEWKDGSFTVICPACGKVNYEISDEKIDSLARELIRDSVEDMEKSKNRQT